MQGSPNNVKDSKDITDKKIKNKLFRELLSKTAVTLEIDLKLNTKNYYLWN